MSEERDRALAIQLDDGRLVVATPKPEDQERLRGLNQEIVLLTAAGDYDTAGHAYSDEIELDVEGHAITLRLPSAADADAVRKALAVGALTATVVAAGAIAAMQGSQATTTAPAPGAPAIERPMPAPQPNAQFMQQRDQAIDPLSEQGMWHAQPGTSDLGPAPADRPNQGTHGPNRGELEGP